jgi:hypothetical protein
VSLFIVDRGQGLNHCICDISNLLPGLREVVRNQSILPEVITSYEAELVPRGREEVKCSIENGYMLHDWDKVKQSPVFRTGFKPMDGHNKVAPGENVQMQSRETEIAIN